MPNILIVDDLKENIDLVSDTLKAYRSDLKLQRASGGLEAMAYIMQNSGALDLIVLDANMPDLDGFTVCQRVKGHTETEGIPILMLSGVHIASTDRSKGLHCGADSYLCKPYHPQELLAQVSLLLSLKAATDRLRDIDDRMSETDETPSEKTEDVRPASRTSTSFKALFNAAPDAIFVESSEGVVLDANPAACALQGLSRQELVGRSVFDLVPNDRREEARRLFKGWFDGSLEKLQSETLGPNGQVLPVEITGRGMVYDGQDAVLLQVRNISHRHALEVQLRRSQKMDAVGRLAGGVAHDFNNLLTTILGFSHIVLDGEGLDADQRGDLLQVINAANRAADLTRQLMVFSRRQLQPLHPVNINAILRDIDPLLRRTIGSQIEVVTLLADDLATIQSDESHIEHIIINVSVNAMDAMPEGGQLTLQTYNIHLNELPEAAPPKQCPGDYAVLEISDTGSGISKEDLDHVIEPFFTTKKAGQGAGLGLSTVFSITQHSRGFMEVESTKEKGTTLRLYFPSTSDPIVMQEMLDQVDLPAGTETVLLVEDEPLVRHLTERQLLELGYSVVSASNGSEALRIMGEQALPVDMVITDIIMPQMGGLELISRIREKSPKTKVLFISGYGDTVFSLANMEQEAHLLLSKPFTKQVLAQRMREVLDPA